MQLNLRIEPIKIIRISMLITAIIGAVIVYLMVGGFAEGIVGAIFGAFAGLVIGVLINWIVIAFNSSFGSKKTSMEISEDYQRWRDLIFLEIKPEQAGVSASDEDRVYGVVMDVGMEDLQSSARFAISLTAFPTGEASFKATPGTGVTGLGSNSEVGEIAKAIVQISQGLVQETNRTTNFSPPEPGIVQFFFLTPSGVRMFTAELEKMERENPFSQLFLRFSLIRESAEKILDEVQAKAGK